MPEVPASLLFSVLCDLTSGTAAHTSAPPMLAHRHAYPCSRSNLTPPAG
jgi:hypothetical protein